MATKQRSKAEQAAAWKAEREAAKAKADRNRRLTTWGFGIGLVATFGVVATLALTSGSSAPTTDASGTQYVADPQAFVLPGLLDAEQTVSLDQFAGTPVVVNFFASWCVYCNEELPGFVQVAKATAGEVAFVGVDTNDPGDGAAMATRFDLAGAGFTLAKDVGGDPPSSLWAAFNSQGLPVTAFYDAEGTLVDFSGGMLTQAALEERIQANFGVDVQAADAAQVGAPVIPLIPQGAYEILRSHPGVDAIVPVDLRTAADFASGHLADALNAPYDDAFATTVAALDPAGSYLLYDATGATAPDAADAMHAAGFRHVYYVQGGLAAWTEQGLPVGS